MGSIISQIWLTDEEARTLYHHVRIKENWQLLGGHLDSRDMACANHPFSASIVIYTAPPALCVAAHLA